MQHVYLVEQLEQYEPTYVVAVYDNRDAAVAQAGLMTALLDPDDESVFHVVQVPLFDGTETLDSFCHPIARE